MVFFLSVRIFLSLWALGDPMVNLLTGMLLPKVQFLGRVLDLCISLPSYKTANYKCIDKFVLGYQPWEYGNVSRYWKAIRPVAAVERPACNVRYSSSLTLKGWCAIHIYALYIYKYIYHNIFNRRVICRVGYLDYQMGFVPYPLPNLLPEHRGNGNKNWSF